MVKNEQGILFLSGYNYQYDWKGEKTRPLGFHDYFFPMPSFKLDSLKMSNNQPIILKNGIRVNHIGGRSSIKTKATYFKGSDSSRCYYLDGFFIIPVLLTYKLYPDNWPLVCRRNYFQREVSNGPVITFNHSHTVMKLIRIEVLSY